MLSSLPCLVVLPYAERVELYKPKHGHGIQIQIDIFRNGHTIQKRIRIWMDTDGYGYGWIAYGWLRFSDIGRRRVDCMETLEFRNPHSPFPRH